MSKVKRETQLLSKKAFEELKELNEMAGLKGYRVIIGYNYNFTNIGESNEYPCYFLVKVVLCLDKSDDDYLIKPMILKNKEEVLKALISL